MNSSASSSIGPAGGPDFASSLGAITGAHVYFVGRSGLLPPIDEVRFAKAPKGTEQRLDWKRLSQAGKTQTLDLKLADGTSTIAAAAGFRYGGPLIGAIVVARPVRSLNASTLAYRMNTPIRLVGVLTSLVGAFYYLRVVKLMYFDDPVDDAPIATRGDARVLLSLNGLALLFLGVFPQQLMGVCVIALMQSF